LKGTAYSQAMASFGGADPSTWTFSGLPNGLTGSSGGLISGTPLVSGNFSINITITDSFNPANVVTRTLTLKVYMLYDANGDGFIDMGDVVKVERIALKLDPVTPSADANRDGLINVGDVIKIERVILGIDPAE